MSRQIQESDYAFQVVQLPIYVKVPDTENPGQMKEMPVRILGNQRLAVVRTDINVALDVVSESYGEANHKDIVDVVRHDLLPRLGWEIVDEDLMMWMEGAIMDYTFITKSSFTIGDTTLFATIHAMNSHNRFTKAGVRIMLQDEFGTSYMPDAGPRSMYTMESLLHRRGVMDLVNLQKIADRIPIIVNTTISQWRHWEKQELEFQRIKIISQLFSLELATHVVEKFPGGANRFELFKAICQHVTNRDKMHTSGFNALTIMGGIVKIMTNDRLFTMPIVELAEFVKSNIKTDWEEYEAKKQERARIAEERRANLLKQREAKKAAKAEAKAEKKKATEEKDVVAPIEHPTEQQLEAPEGSIVPVEEPDMLDLFPVQDEPSGEEEKKIIDDLL